MSVLIRHWQTHSKLTILCYKVNTMWTKFSSICIAFISSSDCHERLLKLGSYHDKKIIYIYKVNVNDNKIIKSRMLFFLVLWKLWLHVFLYRLGSIPYIIKCNFSVSGLTEALSYFHKLIIEIGFKHFLRSNWDILLNFYIM